MADISTLFNLDPTQFALGRSTGRLRSIVGNATRQDQAELGNLLSKVQAVTAEKPGEFTATAPTQPIFGAAPVQPNLPAAPTIAPFTMAKPNVVDPKTTAINYATNYKDYQYLRGLNQNTVNDVLSSYFNNKDSTVTLWVAGSPYTGTLPRLAGGTTYAQAQAKNLLELAQSSYNKAKAAEQAKIDSYNTALSQYKASTQSALDTYKTSVQPVIDKYNAEVGAYNADVRAKTDVYNTEVSAYNKILGEYKSKVDTYNADVKRYQTEVEDTRNKFQREYLSQNVNQELIPAEGEVLAASSLYSDTLHQEMLNKIAEANASEPSTDRVTSLYSTTK